MSVLFVLFNILKFSVFFFVVVSVLLGVFGEMVMRCVLSVVILGRVF